MLRKKEEFSDSILIQMDDCQGEEDQKDDMLKSELQSQIYECYIQNLKKKKFEDKVFSLNDIKLENEEDRPFLILDKDNGKIFDIRNEKVIQDFFDATTKVILSKEDENYYQQQWGDFWQTMKQIHHKLIDFSNQGSIELLEDLFTKYGSVYPIDINHKDFDDMTALHYSSQEGHSECLKFLIKNGANLEAETLFKRRPIHLASMRGNIEIISILIQNKCNFNAQDKELNTPLHLACENNHLQAIVILLSQKASHQLKNHQNLTPNEMSSSTDIQNIFDSFDVKPNMTSSAVQRKTYIDKVLQKGKNDPNKRSPSLTVSELQALGKSANQEFGNKNQYDKTEIIFQTQPKFNIEKLDFLKVLGRGSFGKVYLVRFKDSPDQNCYALKVLSKKMLKENKLLSYANIEKNIMKSLDHPFIVKLHRTFQTNEKLFLMMKFCKGGDLSQLLDKYGRLAESDVKIYVAQVLLALEALHRQNIIYRDLKPANVLIDEDGQAILSDFGLANQKETQDDLSQSFCGTPAYLAPEMLNKTGHNRMIDWYLLGVLLYECLTGITPYYSSDMKDLYSQILNGTLKLPSKGISQEGKQLIIQLLQRNPHKRLGIKEDGKEIKEHPFFKDIDWDKLMKRQYKPSKEPNWIKIPEEGIGKVNFDDEPNEGIVMQDWSFVRQQ